ncbi:Retrovirus-related Pol polyprotein from transposon RE1 (Retro element 1) (AtRE1) [Includes: Protease RE1 [Durusdinium trenchii]|uniref:Retrovirus-related Pol polyprotein from transposon RE1 (Retro element 1) (AtRE1) n=1 Tax=Durusdinium trenchii TaxID=1381693 RepID=A0ABP0HE59_9DINO
MGSESADGPPTEVSTVPWKDKDPPPGFDGDVDKFKDYLRELKMWRHETDVPAVRNEVEVDLILAEGSADTLIAKLKEYYAPHLESAMPKAFERAVYGEARKLKESFGEFIVRQDALFRELREEGVTLDDTVRGHIMFRQANLSQIQEDQVTTWSQGKFDRTSVVSALRKLEKVQRDRGGKHYLTADEVFSEEVDSDEDGDFIYIGEDDLTQIYEESELNEALATYQQVRQAIREQRNGRGYFQPKGSGKSGGSHSASKGHKQVQNIKFSGKGTRVHTDVLKLRTKCAKCGQIGHWAKECTNEPDGKGKSRTPSEGTSPKSGFFEVVSMEGGSSSHAFHLTLGQCLQHARAGRRSPDPPFSGITTQSTMGIVDTAAQGGLIGLPALERLQEALKEHQLKVNWTGKQAQARGIGGSAKVCGVVEIPVGIAGVNGLIEATVVEEEVPFLLSIQFLKQVTRSSKSAMDFLARIRSLDKKDDQKDEWEKLSMADPHTSEKAVRNWRVLMEHVADLMDLVRAEIRLEAWQQGGYVHGSPPCSSFSHLASGSEPFSCLEGANQSQITKASIYAELIQIGDFLGQRKCQMPPARSMKGCEHPLAALAGAGNQSQREVWCRKCHARWAVDRQVMDEIAAKKSTIHVNGKSFHFGGKSNRREKSPPRTPTRTPSAKKASKSPGSPNIPNTPEGAVKMTNQAGIQCHCGQLAVQLIVKKEGPTQGRLFWKCAQRLCNFFEWDPEETRFLQQRIMQEKEDEELKQWQEHEEAERKSLIKSTMEMAEARHQELMTEAQARHSMELETMKNQLLWMSAVAGEERMEQVFQSPELQQAMMIKAMKMKEDLQAQENQAQVADGFWLLEEEKWQFHHGILPDFGSTNHDETVVEFAEDFFEEDHYEPGEDKQLARSSRKALKKKLRQMIVAEVFSPPRMRGSTKVLEGIEAGKYGLAVKGMAPNKKPTDFMTNGEHTAWALSRRCKGDHQHQHLIGGIAKFAQKYPRGLCRAMIAGGVKDVLQETILVWATSNDEEKQLQAEEDIEELLDRHEEEEARQSPGEHKLHNPDDPEEGRKEEEDDTAGSEAVSREDQRLIKKLHVNLGHPSNQELCRALRIARARNSVWRYVKDSFKCEECERNKKPRSARPAVIPRSMEPCKTVGLDVVFFPALDVRQVRPVLNMVDWATGYQMLEPLENTQSNRDSRTERHGGLAKEAFVKLRESALPTSEGEWRMCIYAVEAAKNRLFNRSGFSPAQRQFGRSGKKGKRKRDTNFKVGDIIYVYRVPLQRKRAKTEVTFEDREGRRATWVGPGVIVMIEGANAWLSIRGELWKCAQEQLRHASPEEKEAKEMLQGEFEDLKIEMTRKASKRGYKDITQWESPPPTMDDEEDEEPPHRRQRTRLGTEAEPEAEESQAEINSIPESGNEARARNGEEDPEVVEQAVESNRRCEQLDGTLVRRGGQELYGPTRRHLQSRWRPYQGGYAPGPAEEIDEDDEERNDEDLWVYDEKKGCIIRMHNTERKAPFVPSATRGCPIALKYLTSHRRTVKCYGDGHITVDKENWRNSSRLKELKEKQGPQRWWTGYTEFPLRKIPPEAEVALMVKRGSDEVREEDIPAEEWDQWRISDGAEWSKVAATGAVKALEAKESEDVEKQLKEAGLTARILPSRMVRRWKRSEQPGTPPTRKSRWCIRGDQDPDLLELSRHAPTVTTATLSVVLQIAASKKWKAAVGDLRNVFMQSDKLVRKAGRLFCRQPKGGLPGLEPSQLIEILAGAYGLGDAPAHWRKSLKKVLFQCGFTQSILDPCVFKSFKNGELSGLLVVEVDDLFGVGDSHFYRQMETLRQRFDFGKFALLEQEPEGAGFNGRRIKQKGDEFQIDMMKFVSERLHPVKMKAGRASCPKEPATEEEKEAVRAAVGRKSDMVQDVLDLNKAISQVKENEDLALRIQSIPLEELSWGVVTDASYANVCKGKSQGAFAVLAMEKKVATTGRGKCNLLHWRSGKLHRVVNSTLAAETQSLSRGLAELAWTATVFSEFSTYDFDMKREEKLRNQRLSAMISEEADTELGQNLGIVDAKSLYDHLSRETTGVTSDKRTALEMQVIRQALAKTRTQIKWAPHPSMVVDALTKRQGNVAPLIQLLRSGVLEVQQPFDINKKNVGAVKRCSFDVKRKTSIDHEYSMH